MRKTFVFYSSRIFDRSSKLFQREIAAASPKISDYDFLKEEIGFRLADRLSDIKRSSSICLDLGCGRGFVTRHITRHSFEKVIVTEMSPSFLNQCSEPEDSQVSFQKILHDEENLPLPFSDNSLDAVISNCSLHWVNNLPSLFKDIYRILKPDGFFLGSMFGDDTLFELRCSLQLAESERKGGFSPHISPFIKSDKLGGLLSSAKFKMVTLDTDEFVIQYASMNKLMEDLKGMGENNAAYHRSPLTKDVLLASSAIYREMYASDPTHFPATFNVLYWIAWKAGEGTPVPLSPHTHANVSLKDIHKLDEYLSSSDKNNL